MLGEPIFSVSAANDGDDLQLKWVLWISQIILAIHYTSAVHTFSQSVACLLLFGDPHDVLRTATELGKRSFTTSQLRSSATASLDICARPPRPVSVWRKTHLFEQAHSLWELHVLRAYLTELNWTFILVWCRNSIGFCVPKVISIG